MTGTPWWYRVAWTRCSHAVRSSSKSLYSRTLALASSTCTGGIHDSGRSPLASSSRRWRASDRRSWRGACGLAWQPSPPARPAGPRCRPVPAPPPPSASRCSLHGEGHLTLPLEPGQEGPKLATVGWDDTTPIDLAGDHIQIVVGELAPVQIEPPYDGHAGPPRAPATHRPRRAASARRRPLPYSRLLRLCRGGPPTFHLVAELDGAADAALADRAGVGIVQADQPAGPVGHATSQTNAGLVEQAAGLLDRGLELVDQGCAAPGGGRPRPARRLTPTPPGVGDDTAGVGELGFGQRGDLSGHREHDLFGVTAARAHRPGDLVFAAVRRAPTIPDLGLGGAPRSLDPLGGGGQRADRPCQQPQVGRVGHVGCDNGGVDAQLAAAQQLVAG